MIARTLGWMNRHTQVVDVIVGAGAFLFFAVGVFVDPYATTAGRIVSVALVAPMFVRRRFPFGAPAAAALLCLIQVFVLRMDVLPANALVLVYIYSAAANAPRRWQRYLTLAGGFLGAWVATFRLASPLETLDMRLTAFVYFAILVLIAWVLGEVIRYRATIVARLEEQNRALARDQEQRAQLAAQHERNRIAREMHDIVAHSLAVVVVQADGGAYAARHAAAPPDRALGDAAGTLETVAEHARQALAETRRLVGVLREDTADAEYRPLAGITQVVELVENVRATGHPVEFAPTGDLARVPGEAGTAAYRIVQEALTNVLKHAGPTARAQVRLDVADGLVRVAVTDDGLGAAATDDAAGHGILGMRERAASVGGTLTAGPIPTGGFCVTAELPAAPGDRPTTTKEPR